VNSVIKELAALISMIAAVSRLNGQEKRSYFGGKD